MFQRYKARQRQKCEELRKRKTMAKEFIPKPEWIVDLSDGKLTDAEESILSKDPRYAITPRVNPVGFAAPIEATLQESVASEQTKIIAFLKVCEVIRKARRPKTNITKEEQEAWRELKKDSDIKILQADKGNATVIMNTTDYEEKVRELLNDEDSYAAIKKDPTHAQKTEKPFSST